MSKLLAEFGTSFRAGESIFKEGDPAESLYMVHSGRVEISKGVDETKKILKVIGEAEFFGEMAVISTSPRSATATALEDCKLIVMDRFSFQQAVRDNHHFAISIIRLLTDRLRETSEDFAALNIKSKTHAVYSQLMEKALQGNRDKSGKYLLISREKFVHDLILTLDISHKEIQFILSHLEAEGKIASKKDAKMRTWLAVRLYSA
jgi:CRP-like cAMP-binding protein